MNIKKLFPEKKITKRSFIEFIDKKGFYIVLVLCIAIVGATAVFVTTHNITSSNTEFDTGKAISEEVNDKYVPKLEEKAPVQSSTTSKPVTDQKVAVGNSLDAQQKDSKGLNVAAQDSAAKETQKFIMPVSGEVTYDYAQDKLLYSKTLEEWRSHSGIDLEADKGVTVKAALDGVVTEIKNDPRLGVMVIIEHQSGIKTVYANLEKDSMVTPNQKVKQGDAIGTVGSSAVFESVEKPHIHFEVWKNNEPVNPASYLPKK